MQKGENSVNEQVKQSLISSLGGLVPVPVIFQLTPESSLSAYFQKNPLITFIHCRK